MFKIKWSGSRCKNAEVILNQKLPLNTSSVSNPPISTNDWELVGEINWISIPNKKNIIFTAKRVVRAFIDNLNSIFIR